MFYSSGVIETTSLQRSEMSTARENIGLLRNPTVSSLRAINIWSLRDRQAFPANTLLPHYQLFQSSKGMVVQLTQG